MLPFQVESPELPGIVMDDPSLLLELRPPHPLGLWVLRKVSPGCLCTTMTGEALTDLLVAPHEWTYAELGHTLQRVKYLCSCCFQQPSCDTKAVVHPDTGKK